MTKIEETENGNLIIHIPLTIRKCSGRRQVVMPMEDNAVSNVDDRILQAIARAKEWQEHLNQGNVKSLSELSEMVNIDISYIIRVMRLNNLSPRIVRLFIEGKAPESLSLEKIFKIRTPIWTEQEEQLGITISK